VSNETKWTTEQAIALCRLVEMVCPKFGCHVALTGGLLYKDGERKDCDLVFYRVRQIEKIDIAGLFKALAKLGIERKTESDQFVIKVRYLGRKIDCLFPECEDGNYESDEDVDRAMAELNAAADAAVVEIKAAEATP
jgi:hypothetical protein